jgi:hypothetical protein
MLGYCGRDCETCEAFHASADEGNHCTGCKSEGPDANICGRDCQIRLCARSKRHAICADCNDFPCIKLKNVFDQTPEARHQLYRILGIPPV